MCVVSLEGLLKNSSRAILGISPDKLYYPINIYELVINLLISFYYITLHIGYVEYSDTPNKTSYERNVFFV